MSTIKRRISFTKDLQEELDLRVHRQNDLVQDISIIDGTSIFDDKYISANALKEYIDNSISRITLNLINEKILINEDDKGTLSYKAHNNVIFTGAVNINNEDGTWDLVECSVIDKELIIHSNEPGKYADKYATVSYAYVP